MSKRVVPITEEQREQLETLNTALEEANRARDDANVAYYAFRNSIAKPEDYEFVETSTDGKYFIVSDADSRRR